MASINPAACLIASAASLVASACSCMLTTSSFVRIFACTSSCSLSEHCLLSFFMESELSRRSATSLVVLSMPSAILPTSPVASEVDAACVVMFLAISSTAISTSPMDFSIWWKLSSNSTVIFSILRDVSAIAVIRPLIFCLAVFRLSAATPISFLCLTSTSAVRSPSEMLTAKSLTLRRGTTRNSPTTQDITTVISKRTTQQIPIRTQEFRNSRTIESLMPCISSSISST